MISLIISTVLAAGLLTRDLALVAAALLAAAGLMSLVPHVLSLFSLFSLFFEIYGLLGRLG